MFNRSVTILCLAAAVAGSGTAAAQHRVKETTTLEITLGTNKIADTTAERTYPLDPDRNLFIVHRDVKAKIVVGDTNGLLYDYSATTTSEVSPDYTAALAFAEVLQKLLAAFPKSGGAGIVQPTVDGFAPVTLRDDIEKLAAEIEGIPARLRQSIGGPDDVKKLQDYFADSGRRALPDRVEAQYAAMLIAARKCLGAAQGALTINGHIAIDCDAPYLLQIAHDRSDAHAAVLLAGERLAARSADAGRALTRVQAAKAAVAAWKAKKTLTANEKSALEVAERDLKLADAAHTLAVAAQQAAETERSSAQQAYTEAVEAVDVEQRAGRTLRQFMALALSMDARVQKQIQTFRELMADVDALGRDYVAGTHEYSVKDVRTTKINVEARKKWQPFMPNDVKAAQAAGVRTISVTTDAYRPARVTPGAAFVLGFVKNPTFKAVKDGDAYKIVKDDEELTRYDVAAMLHITPDAWQEPTFGGFFQVGVSPKKDEFGFYFGAGFQSHSIFAFGGGFMMQQVRTLGPGLTEVSRLASPDELKTSTTFKPGLYLHATVTMPQKK